MRRDGDEAHALEEFKVAARLMPDNPIAWCDLGLALKSSGDPHAAIDAFRRALAIQPDYFDASANLANLLWRQGRVDEAEAS